MGALIRDRSSPNSTSPRRWDILNLNFVYDGILDNSAEGLSTDRDRGRRFVHLALSVARESQRVHVRGSDPAGALREVVDGVTVTRESPTGVSLVRASRLVAERPPSDDSVDDVGSVRLGVEEMLSLGVISTVDLASRMGHTTRFYQESASRGHLRLPIAEVGEGTFNAHGPQAISAHLDGIKVNNPGDRFVCLS